MAGKRPLIERLSRGLGGLGRSSAFRAALAFTLLLWLYEFAVLGYDADRQDLLFRLEQGGMLALVRSLALSAVSLVLVAAFVTSLLRAPVVAKIAGLLLFAMVLCIEYAHHTAFERFSTYSTAAVGVYAGDWIFSAKALAMYFNALCLPPILALLVLLIVYRREKTGLKGLLALAAAGAAFAGFTAFFTSNRFLTASPWAQVRTAIGFPVISLLGRENSEAFGAVRRARRAVLYQASRRPANNIVLIVDESVRGDHLHLNGYPSNRVPVLSALLRSGDMANYGIASSGSTCSMASNNLLLTGLNQLPDRKQQIYEMPTVFQYARAMGYRTYEFDGSVSRLWKGTQNDLTFVDNREIAGQLAGAVDQPYEIDSEIARRVKQIVAGSTGNFIWVNKRGVHKPYSENFPGARATFLDALEVGYDRRISTAKLVADYDASIRYNLNQFFGPLLEGGKPSRNTLYLYTSDHGQSLREGGVKISHCGTSHAEAVVPLFIIGSKVADRFDTGYRASHANIFPTLLDLMGVPRTAREYRYALSLAEAKAADSGPRFYFDADLTGEDGGRRYPFDR